MIDFQHITVDMKDAYQQRLLALPERGCEYTFTNLYLWGRQKIAFLGDNVVFFSQFNQKSVYPFPLCRDKLKETVEALIRDAAARGIPCRLTGLTAQDCDTLEQLFPGLFRFHTDRNGFDYVYSIEELCTLAGRKYQRKRNHLNRFFQLHPDARTEPITSENIQQVRQLVTDWYDSRLAEDPTMDFHMERSAIKKALEQWQMLDMEGLLLLVEGKAAAMTLGSRLSATTFDVHFEKALERYEGAYPAINREFARYLHEKYPELTKLNREEDMGLEGLRKAKLSYNPTHLQEKYWACLLEDGYDY